MEWAKEQAKMETHRYKKDNDIKTVLIPFHSDRQMDHHKKKCFLGGYLFLQSVYYSLRLDQTCRKIKAIYKFKYDLNAVLSDLIYTRILEPASKRSSFHTAQKFLEPPSYELHDICHALRVLSKECDLIQSEAYKNSRFAGKRNDHILYYDCTNYYFEISRRTGTKNTVKQRAPPKSHHPDGAVHGWGWHPPGFPPFPRNQNEQTSLKPLEKKILQEFGYDKFIYCSDAGLGSENSREFNHMGKRAFIVTQSIKKLPAEDREWALARTGINYPRCKHSSTVSGSYVASHST